MGSNYLSGQADRSRLVKIDLAGIEVQMHAQPGEVLVSPAEALLAGVFDSPSGRPALLSGARMGALAVRLARQVTSGSLAVLDHNLTVLDRTRQTLALNRVENVTVIEQGVLPDELAGQVAAAALILPKGRKLPRRRLLEARLALQPGGRLYLAGANNQGIQSVIKDAAELFGRAAVLAYKKGNRVALAIKPPGDLPKPEWAGEPGVAPGTWHEYEVEVRGQQLSLRSLAGVFSYDRLDEGTALLLEHLPNPAGLRVLDAGCGVGVIGLVAARLGAAWVDLVDVDLLAVTSARENLRLNDIPNAGVFPFDGVPAAEAAYDLVVSNPPFHTGKEVNYRVAGEIIAGSQRGLVVGGRLVIVANRFIRYEQVMRPAFASVQVLAETGKFRVLEAIHPG